MIFVASDHHRAHDPSIEVSWGSPAPMFEVPRRADAIREKLEADTRFLRVEMADHGLPAIEAVHDPRLVTFITDAWTRFQADARRQREVFPDVMAHPAVLEGMGAAYYPTTIEGQLGYWCWETNTPLVAGTYPAARASVDIALTALDRVDAGEPVAYALCRPPGHHAPRAAYGGYCYFNNAAIVAQAAIDRGRSRVAVLDVDFHHGNGTQQIFWRRSDVMYASLHGDPARAYPYFCGTADEVGVDAGIGTTLNVPIAAGTGDDEYLDHLTQAVQAIDDFDPELVVVSLGLDTSAGDPLGDLLVTGDGMARCGRLVAELNRRTVIVQEGGYDLATVAIDAHQWLSGFAGFSSPPATG